MTTKLLRSVLMLTLGLCLTTATVWAQTGTIKGHITDQATGEALISANVFISSLSQGAATDVEGNFTIEDVPYGTYILRVSYIGYKTKNVPITVDGATETVNVTLLPAVGTLDELVVTALGGTTQKRAITSAQQTVSAEELTVAPNTNVKTSLAGKVAGVQILGQAGAKLGMSGEIRIRGEVSLTAAASEPLYVVDGVPVGTNPNIVDMTNVAQVTVLKGANATALYGQRGENGVILITTQRPDARGVSVEVSSAVTFQKSRYLPDYQNQYGQGYAPGKCGTAREADGSVPDGCGMIEFMYDPAIHPDFFKALDGQRLLTAPFADASWGPKLDGEPYAAWYTWWPDSPYYTEGAPYSAKPDNIKSFYETGFRVKNSIAINLFQERFTGRISYSNLQQGGITPYTDLAKHFLAAKVGYDVTEAFHVDFDVNYTTEEINGQSRSDGYGNNTSGSFHQWFGRQLSVKKMKELKYLKTPSGYFTSWNWWGPDLYTAHPAYQKPTFWFNPYTWMAEYDQIRNNDNMLMSFQGSYQLSDQFELVAAASTYQRDLANEWYVPFSIEESSAHPLYISYVNSFGMQNWERRENNYSSRLNYRSNYADWSFDAFVGGNIRAQRGSYNDMWMDRGNYQSGGLNIPDVYQFSNSAEIIIPTATNYEKRVYSLYGKLSVGYQDLLFITGTYRQDWSSALPENANGYGYPSIGTSFVFSELMNMDVISYGRVRVNWAQTGDDVDAEDLIQSYGLRSVPFVNPTTDASTPLLYTGSTLVDPNITPALNSSFEAGLDLRFFNSRVGLSATFYQINRQDEIIPVEISTATGRNSYLTNGGRTQRNGLELVADGYIISNSELQWNLQISASTGKTMVKALPAGLDVFTMDLTDDSDFGWVHLAQVKNKEWGQLKGVGFKRDEQGRKIIAVDSNGDPSGIYVTEPNHFFGGVLADYLGGILNSFTYKNINFSFLIDFQIGGKFFSLSEMWGTNTGLMAETAGLNDKGNPLRDPVSEGGGVHVTGVTESGEAVDMYVYANTYYSQFVDNDLAEPFVHSSSFVKLRAGNLSYTLPADLFGGAIKRATLGIVARNLLMIWTDNPYGWDPSEFSDYYGENAQLPGTRSIGFNVNLTF